MKKETQAHAKKPEAKPSAADATPSKKPVISERGRNALFGVLAILAICAAAYVLFFSAPQDKEADGSGFYARLTSSDKVGLFYDVRGAQGEQASAIYQCGVDMIGKGRFAGKAIEVIACEDSGCIDSSTDRNGTTRISYDEARRKISGVPYIVINAGEPAYKFFERHMEITIGANVSGNVTCDISATEG
ncbi:MAG: hypothetical protein WCT52_05545 [Candidatus Micrarchaeia archaeon]